MKSRRYTNYLIGPGIAVSLLLFGGVAVAQPQSGSETTATSAPQVSAQPSTTSASPPTTSRVVTPSTTTAEETTTVPPAVPTATSEAATPSTTAQAPSSASAAESARPTPTAGTYPNATVIPGQMRSDREKVPDGFTKADADKAETMEARLKMARVAPGCQVYWPAPYEVCGAIRDKYNSLGGPNSFLLFPKSNELVNPDGFGRRSEFLGGNIYWSPATGAHFVAHDFLTKWGNHGYEGGWMKYPMSDEIVNPDNVGRRQQFQGGMIYWSPISGAHSINGRILDRWGQLGFESGVLGYPTSDEINSIPEFAPNSQRMNWFIGGAILWDGPANTTRDAFRQNWAAPGP